METVRPADLREARDAVCAGPTDRAALRFVGAGTKQDWGRPPARVDRLIETSALCGVIEHDAGDMTARVRAGTSLRELEHVLSAAGQRLALDPALGPDGAATIGGAFATDDAGPSRLRYGSLRDLVIGATFVLSDGTVARAGGRVIKNVAGYDVCKLLCGSLGTLALVTELTVRLHAIPQSAATLRAPADEHRAARLTLALLSSPLEPDAIAWDGEALLVRFEGRERAARGRLERALELAGGLGLDAHRLVDDAAAWRAAREAPAAVEGEAVVRLGVLPARLPGVLEAARRATAELSTTWSSPAPGLAHVRLGRAPIEALARAVTELRAAARALDGHAVLRSGPARLRRSVDPFGPVPGSGIARRLRDALDPGTRCAPGVVGEATA